MHKKLVSVLKMQYKLLFVNNLLGCYFQLTYQLLPGETSTIL